MTLSIMTNGHGFSLNLDLRRRRRWAYVAAFGATWGALEITAGSFLHTLKLPFAGVMLACLGAALLVAQRQLLPDRGVTAATGLVAALCKSLSPGGVIFGPMLGISVEALLVELALFAAPRAWPSALLAGVLAAEWALSQKLLVQVLFYGGDVITLYLTLIERGAAGLHLPPGSPWQVLAWVVALPALAGLAAGFLGHRLKLPRAESRLSAPPPTTPQPATSWIDQLTTASPSQRTGRGRLRRRILAATALVAIALQFPGRLSLSLVALALWLAALLAYDRATLRRLWKPRFWLVTLTVSLAGGLVLGRRDIALFGVPLSSAGLSAGALMVVRGALIFGLTTWGAALLTPARLARWGSRLGQSQLTLAASVALRLVPELTSRLQLTWKRRRDGGRRAHSLHAWREMILQAAEIAEEMAKGSSPAAAPAAGRYVIAVVGDRGSGKTSTLRRLASLLASQGIDVGGVVQPAVLSGGERLGYQLEEVPDGERRDFACRVEAGPGYRFDQDGWHWADALIRRARRQCAVVIVDELGRIEAEGGGHLPALLASSDNDRSRVWLLGIRADASSAIERRLGPFSSVLAPSNEAHVLEHHVRDIVGRTVPSLPEENAA